MEEQLLESEFVTYPLALKLKDLGFNEMCLATFYEDGEIEVQDFFQNYDTFPHHVIAAPTWQSAFDWFETNHQLYPSIVIDQTSYPKYAYEISVFIGNPKDLTEREWYWDDKILSPNLYRTRIEARVSCIEKLCEIVESKK